MKSLLLLLTLTLANTAFADDVLPYGGIGLETGSLGLETASGASKSTFTNHGYLAEGGVDIGSKWGIRFAGEYGKSIASSSSSPTYMQATSTDYMGAKAGLWLKKIAFGAGYRKNNATIKTLQNSGEYSEASYSGATQFGFATFSVDLEKRYRASIEAQYGTGKLKGEDSSMQDVKFTETTVSLRFFLLFD